MGAKSRTKGQAGEREIAALIRDLTGFDVRRRVRQHDGDSDLEGVPGWSVEVKRAAKPELSAWWLQTVEQARMARGKPVLFYRLDRQQWRARWPLCLVLGAEEFGCFEWGGLEWTADTTVEAWAAVMREVIV